MKAVNTIGCKYPFSCRMVVRSIARRFRVHPMRALASEKRALAVVQRASKFVCKDHPLGANEAPMWPDSSWRMKLCSRSNVS